jgi:hypothetical protein
VATMIACFARFSLLPLRPVVFFVFFPLLAFVFSALATPRCLPLVHLQLFLFFHKSARQLALFAGAPLSRSSITQCLPRYPQLHIDSLYLLPQ